MTWNAAKSTNAASFYKPDDHGKSTHILLSVYIHVLTRHVILVEDGSIPY
jgi:hypothetical protein